MPRISNTKTTEEIILQNAMDVFIEKGRHGARMQDIADRAGINKAMLHYYFRSKDKLYAQIFELVFVKYFGELLDVFKEENRFETTLKSFINRYIDILDENPRLPVFVASEMLEGGSIVEEIISSLIRSDKFQVPHKMIHAIDRAVKSGEIVAVDHVNLMMNVIGACIYFFIAEPVFRAIFSMDNDYDRKKFIEDRKKAIFENIYYGISARGESK